MTKHEIQRLTEVARNSCDGNPEIIVDQFVCFRKQCIFLNIGLEDLHSPLSCDIINEALPIAAKRIQQAARDKIKELL